MRTLAFGTVLLIAAFSAGQNPGAEGFGPAQNAADILRDVSGSDGAFIAAGMIKQSFNKDDLSSLLQFPDDEIVVVSLKGSEIRSAFERSISLYPQSNASFLQVSGFEIAFDPNGPPNAKIKGVTASGSKLDDSKEYRVAMPSSLGRGGFGYFRIWDRAKISRTLEGTIGKTLQGKKASESKSRWIAQP